MNDQRAPMGYLAYVGLVDGDVYTGFSEFARLVIKQAVTDHREGKPRRRSGADLVALFNSGPHRQLHWKMASMIYNTTRRELKLRDESK